MYLMRQIGATASTRRTCRLHGVPRLEELPWQWWNSDQFWWCALLAIVLPGLLALRLRLSPPFRSRVKGVYFSIITQALTFASAMLAFLQERHGLRRQQRPSPISRRILGLHDPDTRDADGPLFASTGAG
jgi:urea transport system permease protein